MASPLSIFCNGNPKSGTHAVLQIVEALGCDQTLFARALDREEAYTRPSFDKGGESVLLSEEAKAAWDKEQREFRIERSNRDTRKTLAEFPRTGEAGHCHISWRRRNLLGDLPVVTIFRNPRDNFLSWQRWWVNGEPLSFFDSYRSFLGWTRLPHVTYDTLFQPASVLLVARAMGCDVTEARAEEIIGASYGRSTTWSGKVSNHQKSWTPELDSLWKASGGEELDAIYEEIKAGSYVPPKDSFDAGFLFEVTAGPQYRQARRMLGRAAPQCVVDAYRNLRR